MKPSTFRTRRCGSRPFRTLAVEARRIAVPTPTAPRAAEDCGGVGGGAAGDGAAGAAAGADRRTEKGAPAPALHRRPPRRTPKTNRHRPRAGELGGSARWNKLAMLFTASKRPSLQSEADWNEDSDEQEHHARRNNCPRSINYFVLKTKTASRDRAEKGRPAFQLAQRKQGARREDRLLRPRRGIYHSSFILRSDRTTR